MGRRIDMVGDRYGRLVVEAEAEPHVIPSGHAFRTFMCRCDCGTVKRILGNALRAGPTQSCGCLHRELASREPSYRNTHARIRDWKGSARKQTCACGAPARDWAYDHGDPDERKDVTISYGVPRPVTYSLDPSHYTPMCKPCHTSFDRQWAKHAVPS